MGGKAKGTRQMAIAGNSWTDVDDASLRDCQGGQQQLGVVGGPSGRNWSFPSSAYELHALPPAVTNSAQIKVANLHWLGTV
jgi:hypothetical protein